MRIFPLGECAATVEFGSGISLELNQRSVGLASRLAAAPFPGMTEAVPAYSSVTVYFDPVVLRNSFPAHASAHEAVSEILAAAASELNAGPDTAARTVEIPVTFSQESSPDLPGVCEFSGLSADEVITIFLERTYRVFMLGFLPGFPYMGEVDERIAAPRLSTPRTRVPRGSVGIAGVQTGVYPLASPGGWNIIARTDLPVFDRHAPQPCLLRPGDHVKFTPL